MQQHRKLKSSELRFLCDPCELGFETTDQLEPLEQIIGQQRAVRAVDLGLGMRSFGYNIYVAGSPGTGKKTLIRSLVEKIASRQDVPPDIFYVHNFDDPDHPRVILVPAGTACKFKRDMTRLLDTLKEEIPKAFKSEDYESRRNAILQTFQMERAKRIDSLQKRAREMNLAVKTSGAQILTVPLIDGKEVTPEEFEELPEQQQQELRKKQKNLSEIIQETYREIRRLQQETQEKVRELDQFVALIATGHFLDELRDKYASYSRIIHYLDSVQEDLVDQVDNFLKSTEKKPESELPPGMKNNRTEPLRRYSVNVVVDNSRQQGAPVVSESNPNYRNLIGFMEREARMGTLYTDFTMIRSGSILKANGGYLIMDLVDLLLTPLAWEALKRAIQDSQVHIQDPLEQHGMIATAGLRPEPVPVDLKVIILGSSELYHLLYNADEDFQKLFKVRADFDTIMKRDESHTEQYARFVHTLCEKEKLRHFDCQAVATLIEHSSRMVSDKTRLTLRFSDMADLIRESNYWASKNGDTYVRKGDVQQAIAEKKFRSNLAEERLQQMIDEQSILLQISGTAVGQLNGLSVFQVGDYAFGKPTRLTAEVSAGEQGVVNIEREARLSGRIHDKGVLILSGYLHGMYGRSIPLSLNASICFEQSYTSVDGDSASSAELFAILSSLSGLPLRQSLAVTGSMNQKGMVQPIGGVNEKIEGFFQTCRAQELNGEQGVIIPRQNVQNLMLSQEVIEAVEAEQFHIFAIETVDEGIEILTSRPAGKRQPDGTFPEGTVHRMVLEKLREMYEIIQRRYSSQSSIG